MTNKIIVNACIRRNKEAYTFKDDFGQHDIVAESISKLMAYHSQKLHAIRRVCTPYECGQLIKESGISPQDYILEWSLKENHSFDLPKLRKMLSDVGFHDLLPPDANCVCLIPHFRLNIPRAISLSLEFIFPLTHPGHPLIGTNHVSDNDVRMTRLMVLFYLKRLKISVQLVHQTSEETNNETEAFLASFSKVETERRAEKEKKAGEKRNTEKVRRMERERETEKERKTSEQRIRRKTEKEGTTGKGKGAGKDRRAGKGRCLKVCKRGSKLRQG